MEPSAFLRNAAKLWFLNVSEAICVSTKRRQHDFITLPSEKPNRTAKVCFSLGIRQIAQPLLLTARTSSQYLVSLSISFSSLVAEFNIVSTVLLRFCNFHPFAIRRFSCFLAGSRRGACSLSAPNAPNPTMSLSAGEIVWPA